MKKRRLPHWLCYRCILLGPVVWDMHQYRHSPSLAARSFGEGIMIAFTEGMTQGVMMTNLTENDIRERRLKSCVDQWPECNSGEYNPACCRFPKSCSPHGYIEAVLAGNLTEDDLEPLPNSNGVMMLDQHEILMLNEAKSEIRTQILAEVERHQMSLRVLNESHTNRIAELEDVHRQLNERTPVVEVKRD